MKPTTAPRTRIFCGVTALSFSSSDVGSPSSIPPTVLASLLNLMASGLKDEAAKLLRDVTQQPLIHCEDVVDFLLDMVKPAKAKTYRIESDHVARADLAIQKALNTLIPKPKEAADGAAAMASLGALIASILKMPEMRGV